MRPIKILSLSTCQLDPVLGSGKTRLRWSQGLRDLGHSVDMVEPRDYETLYGMRRALRFRQAWGALSFVKERLATNDYDLIEFFGGEFGLITWQLSKLQKRPLVVAHTDGVELLASERERAYNAPDSFKCHLRGWFSSLTHERLSRAAFVYADAFVTGCALDRTHVLNLGLYPPDRTAVIQPGLDREYIAMPWIMQKQERVAYTGSWISRKGIDILSRVMSRVLIQKPYLYFDVYGTGGDREAVLGHFPDVVHDRIIVYPRLSNQEIACGLAKAKIFFFPSQYEGFGMALAEAMACSCAAVTTRTGFGAELFDGDEAVLCDFNDAEVMERSIINLLENEELRSRIARGAWARVQSLTWDTNTKLLEAIYLQWVSEYEEANSKTEDRSCYSA
jgi:glycosyltransferase involved in cell wall biosynthesis